MLCHWLQGLLSLAAACLLGLEFTDEFRPKRVHYQPYHALQALLQVSELLHLAVALDLFESLICRINSANACSFLL